MQRILEDKVKLEIEPFLPELAALIAEKQEFLDNARGNFEKFRQVVDSLPEIRPSQRDLDAKAVTIGRPADLSASQSELLAEKLRQLCPWRKGPFDLFGIKIDSEWQSWMKWDRLADVISPLTGRKILDIGSSNGYYMFRMAAHDPLMVLGIEPQSQFYFQYRAVQKLLRQPNVYCLPVPFEQMPQMDDYFDTVFCMGVLYHRNSPLQMLKQIHDLMRPGGELVLENLVLKTRKNLCLFPRDRYAKMRNVFFIPDLLAMEAWLSRAGFKNIRCVDITKTQFEEQRKTDWIQTETLKDFLDPDDPDKTVEGYPAPVRAVFIAEASM